MDKIGMLTLLRDANNNLLDVVEKLEDYGVDVPQIDKDKIYDVANLLAEYTDKVLVWKIMKGY